MAKTRNDDERWLEDLRIRLDAMRRTLEDLGRARRQRRWEAEDRGAPADSG